MSLRRPLRVLGDGLFENGRRVTAKPFSCFDFSFLLSHIRTVHAFSVRQKPSAPVGGFCIFRLFVHIHGRGVVHD